MNTKLYLEKLGWRESFVSIYLALAERGELTVLKLSRLLAKPRSTLYLELEAMQSQGLVTSKSEGKTTKFKALPVSAIRTILERKVETASALLDTFSEFAKTIKENSFSQTTQYEVLVYKGADGIKQLLWNILTSEEKEVVGFSPGTLEHVTDRAFAEKWRTEFKERGKHNKIIVNKAVPLTWSDVPNFLTKEYVEVRTLEGREVNFSHEVWFYGNTLVVISTKDDPEQYGIEITDRLLVAAYRQLFTLVWDSLATVVE